jgi:glycosyltransferase involved in cell wall biosynthesis
VRADARCRQVVVPMLRTDVSFEQVSVHDGARLSLTRPERELVRRVPIGLNILHVLRAPVGGLFRHVVDLARGQIERGHRVGVIADSTTGSAQADATLAGLSRELALGLTRVPMNRQIGLRDAPAVRHAAQRAADVKADVIHGHGAKGGAYVRLAPDTKAVRVYTPHGGSLHYGWGSPAGLFYLAAERALKSRTDLIVFESAFGRDVFRAKIGESSALVRVVHNGVTAGEFEPVVADRDASDLVFVGELRALKGVDVLIDALGLLARQGHRVSATIAGDGPDRKAFDAQVVTLGLTGEVRFIGATPTRAAFARGRLLVVPSRAESLPYIVLEAAAAGVPLVATNVGGIPEIFGPDAAALIPPGDPAALARAIKDAFGTLALEARTARLKARVREQFSAGAMTDAVLAAYADALADRVG